MRARAVPRPVLPCRRPSPTATPSPSARPRHRRYGRRRRQGRAEGPWRTVPCRRDHAVMRTVDPRTGIEVLDYAECLRLLATKQVGRIGFAIWGGPEILPVNYVLDGDAVVFATGAGS